MPDNTEPRQVVEGCNCGVDGYRLPDGSTCLCVCHLEVSGDDKRYPTEDISALEAAWNAWREDGNIGYPLNEGTRHSAFEGGWSAAGVEVRALREALLSLNRNARALQVTTGTMRTLDQTRVELGAIADRAAQALAPEPPVEGALEAAIERMYRFLTVGAALTGKGHALDDFKLIHDALIAAARAPGPVDGELEAAFRGFVNSMYDLGKRATEQTAIAVHLEAAQRAERWFPDLLDAARTPDPDSSGG